MSWICSYCETENPDVVNTCEVCNTPRRSVLSCPADFDYKKNDNHKIAEWQNKAILYEKKVVNYSYLVSKYGFNQYNDIILFAPYLLYSADQGNPESQFMLGELFLNHWKYEYKANAFPWFSRAANQGDGNAMEKIAFCFEEGIGVERDYMKAKKWYLRALYNGCKTAQQGIKRINNKTSSYELDL